MTSRYRIRGALHNSCSRFLGLGFAGNLNAQKLNKAQTKQANITSVQYFAGFGPTDAHINRSGSK